jgi:hypothetical protein
VPCNRVYLPVYGRGANPVPGSRRAGGRAGDGVSTLVSDR